MKRLTQDEFLVKVKNIFGSSFTVLSEYKNNITNIEVKHNICGNTFFIRPMEFWKLKNNRCPKCLYNKNNKKVSIDEIERIINEKYNNEYKIIEYLGKKKKITVLHKSCGNTFSKNATSDFLKSETPCPFCYQTTKRLSNETFAEYFEATDSDYKMLSCYKNSREKILVKHIICGNIYEVTPNKFKLGRRCPFCSRNIKKTIDEVRIEIENISNKEYSLESDSYENTDSPISIRHNVCGRIFKMRRTDFIKSNGNRCPFCSRSKGEEAIQKILDDNLIPYKRHFSFNELKRFHFDFAIFNTENEIKCLIEFDGEFHYKPIFGMDRLALQKARDSKKDQFCIENNLKLVRIPYFVKIETILKDIIKLV